MSLFDEIEDLKIFTAGEFSTHATVTRLKSEPVGETLELSGIFDENYQDMFGTFDAQPAEGRKFCLQVQTEQIETLKNGDRLTVKGKNYLITSIQPQHDGKMSHLILKQDFS